jgi:hypothetical protein
LYATSKTTTSHGIEVSILTTLAQQKIGTSNANTTVKEDKNDISNQP